MKFGTMHMQFSKIVFTAVVKLISSSCGKNLWGLLRPWVGTSELVLLSRGRDLWVTRSIASVGMFAIELYAGCLSRVSALERVLLTIFCV